jgi:hypothetical protein
MYKSNHFFVNSVFGQQKLSGFWTNLLQENKWVISDSRFKDVINRQIEIFDSTTISLFQEILKSTGHNPTNGKRKGGIKNAHNYQCRLDCSFGRWNFTTVFWNVNLLMTVVQKMLKRSWAFSNLVSFCKIHLFNYIHLLRFLEDTEKDWCKTENKLEQLTLFWGAYFSKMKIFKKIYTDNQSIRKYLSLIFIFIGQ